MILRMVIWIMMPPMQISQLEDAASKGLMRFSRFLLIPRGAQGVEAVYNAGIPILMWDTPIVDKRI